MSRHIYSGPSGETRSAGTVLRIGNAVAVLMAEATGGREARDAKASTELRRVTGHDDISIRRRSSGRPYLAPPYPELGVSLARRGSLLLAGFSPTGNAGVDLELDVQDDRIEPARLAADHYSPNEAAWIAAQPASLRAGLFMRLWVAKEAVLKLTGRGVYDGLRSPDFAMVLDQLERDGRPFRLPPLQSSPPATVLVCPLKGPSGVACYGSLAVRADCA